MADIDNLSAAPEIHSATVAPLSGEAEKPRPVDASQEPEAPGLLSDCRLMLSYARKNAFVLAPELIREIAWLDSVLNTRGIAPISAITSKLVSALVVTDTEPLYVAAQKASSPSGAAVAASTGMSVECVVLDVHAELSLLISPTTALSLQTSEPPSGKSHILGGMPPLVRTVIFLAVGSAFVFVFTALGIAGNAAKTAAAEKAASAPAAASASTGKDKKP